MCLPLEKGKFTISLYTLDSPLTFFCSDLTLFMISQTPLVCVCVRVLVLLWELCSVYACSACVVLS